MPTKIEKDIVSGRDTTGHDWDGVKELNTPLPNWWVIIFAACIVFAAIQCLLYPSFPGVTGYFHGLLGYSQRTAVDRAVAEVQAQRAEAMNRIATASFDDIRKDPQLMAVAMAAGRIIPATVRAAVGNPASRRSPQAPGFGVAPCRRCNRPSPMAFAAAIPRLAAARCSGSAPSAS